MKEVSNQEYNDFIYKNVSYIRCTNNMEDLKMHTVIDLFNKIIATIDYSNLENIKYYINKGDD